jgi:hypothetical protein
MYWLEKECICDQDGKKLKGLEWDDSSKHKAIIEVLSRKHEDEKWDEDILEKVIGDNKSDVANNLRLA